jgi:hypothetical protein
MDWAACYFDHYQRFFGEARARLVFRPYSPGASIQVLAYDRVFPSCITFASIGLSHYAKEVSGVAEVYFPLDDGWDQASYLLANALFAIVNAKMEVGWGFTISVKNIMPKFVDTFQKVAFYFTKPRWLPEGFQNVQCNDQVGRVRLAAMISQAELDFLRQEGAEKLEVFFAEKDVDTTHLARQSCL